MLNFFRNNSNVNEKSEDVSKEIAELILKQEDKLLTVCQVFEHLEPDLASWLLDTMKARKSTKSFTEIDISEIVAGGNIILPGDVIIKKNRDPRQGDFVEIRFRSKDSYVTEIDRVLKINIKEGSLFVEDGLYPEIKGNINLVNVIWVIDKIIKYEDPEWEKITQALDIEYYLEDIKMNLEGSIEFLEKNDSFYDRENTLKKLYERLELVNRHSCELPPTKVGGFLFHSPLF